MKKLLVVLFGLLAFQGSVWADSCLKNWPPDEDSVAIARILFPVEAEQVISKRSSFGLVWHEKDAIGESLGGKVNIRLYERGKETRDLFNNRLQNKNNTGFFLINKKDFSAVKVIADKEYYFEVQGAGKAGSKARIHSECFTFDFKKRENLQCDSAIEMKECIKVLVAQNNSALARISVLEERLDASKNSGASSSTIINQNTAHSHSEYAEEGHSHDFGSSTHNHDDADPANFVTQEQFHYITQSIANLESRVSVSPAASRPPFPHGTPTNIVWCERVAWGIDQLNRGGVVGVASCRQ
mgnify:CR=1 FL=1